MLGKYKTASLLIVLIVVCATAASAAPSSVNQLGLSRDGSFTVLTIQGSDQLRYAHQSVEAKEGKPFRIVIDCLASRHGLPQKEYVDLPRSIIKSIRTSQYSVSPEEVVRVVLDLNEESVYRVETEGNTIKVLVSDQKTAPFSKWNSRAVKTQPLASVTPTVKAEKPTVEKPKTAPVQKPRQVAGVVADQPKPAKPVVAKKPSVVTQKEKKAKPAVNASPYVAELPDLNKDQKFSPVLATTATPTQNQPIAQKATKSKPESQPVVAKTKSPTTPTKPVNKQATMKKDLVNDSIEKAKFFASINTDQAKVPEPGMTTDKGKAKKKHVHKATPAATKAKPIKKNTPADKPKAVNSTPSVPPPVKQKKGVVLASNETTDQKPAAPETAKVEKIRTSKYRRESAKSAEMKATQVVQFPRRMVIKYKRPSPRDPFESLISADKNKKGNVDLTKVPNIETLNLVGILEPLDGKGAALLEDREGIGYILRPGDKVRNGYVAQIDDYAIYFQINEYGWGRTIVKHMEKDK